MVRWNTIVTQGLWKQPGILETNSGIMEVNLGFGGKLLITETTLR